MGNIADATGYTATAFAAQRRRDLIAEASSARAARTARQAQRRMRRGAIAGLASWLAAGQL
jgi:hypothetical protein